MQVLRNHAGGARRSWFHLYGLLVLGEAAAVDEREDERAVDGDEETRYRHIASALEAFVQTSTIGEFEARLRLLDSFHGHLTLRLRDQEGHAEGGLPRMVAAHTAAALANTVRYYRQFSPAVRRRIESDLTPLEKDLQVCVCVCVCVESTGVNLFDGWLMDGWSLTR